MKIPFLMVRDVDALILGCMWHDDPDNGPTKPQLAPPPGVTLVPGEISRVGRRDSEAAYWREEGDIEWVETSTLDEARALAWTAAKRARDAAESADFEFAGTLYQPDVAKITGAVLAALLPSAEADPFAIDWTVSDNSVVTLNAQQVMSLGLTLTARINGIHQRGRALRDLINNATTPAEAYGFTWNSLDA